MSQFYSKQAKLDANEGKVDYIELGFLGEDTTLSVKIAVHNGNNLFSYIVDEKELIFYDASLPMASFAVGNPILFPFPNRIEDAMYAWKDTTYLQKKNGIPIQLHSLVYDETSFEKTDIITDKQSITLKTTLDVDETHPIYKGYPFSFRLYISYILSADGLTIEYILKNKCDEDMPYGMAFHPYFNKINGDKNTTIHVPCQYYYETRNDVEPEFFNKMPGGFGMTGNILPTGNLLSVSDTKHDIMIPTAVGDLDVDTVYTNLEKNPIAQIDYKDSDIKLSISGSQEFCHYVVYTPKGKDFFCIEPQTCSTDAINLFNQGIKHVNLLTCPPSGDKKGFVKYTITK